MFGFDACDVVCVWSEVVVRLCEFAHDCYFSVCGGAMEKKFKAVLSLTRDSSICERRG